MLRASVVSSWRGPLPDALSRVFEAELAPRRDLPGYISIDREIDLADGKRVRVYCGRSPDGVTTLSVWAGEMEVVAVSCSGPVNVAAFMPDQNRYEFQLLAGPVL